MQAYHIVRLSNEYSLSRTMALPSTTTQFDFSHHDQFHMIIFYLFFILSDPLRYGHFLSRNISRSKD
jgi:hypothetical protein